MRITMDNLGRRTALEYGIAAASIAAALAAGISLAACANQTTTQLQQDVQTIDTGLAGISTDLAALPNNPVSANTMTSINAELALIQSDASQIAQAASPGQTVYTTFVEAVTTLAGLVTPFAPEAPTIAALVTAAASLAQTVAQEAGLVSVEAAAATPLYTMPPAVARAVLQGAAKK